MPMVTRSGDQIGVDRAAIDFAIANCILSGSATEIRPPPSQIGTVKNVLLRATALFVVAVDPLALAVYHCRHE
jgi:hypothetical protein